MWSISCTCVFKLGCKGYCLWTDLHSVKASCFQSRFFSLLKVFVCIDFCQKKLLLWIAEQYILTVQGVSLVLWNSEFNFVHLAFLIIGEAKFLYGSSHSKLWGIRNTHAFAYSSYCSSVTIFRLEKIKTYLLFIHTVSLLVMVILVTLKSV